MEMPIELKPAFYGVIIGAAALAFTGFVFGGWVTGSAAETLAKERADKAVIAVLAPICADNFKRATDAQAQRDELMKAKSWEQAELVQKGGWVKPSGPQGVDRAVASACADLIVSAKP